MKALLSFFALFSAIIFLLPLAALGSDKTATAVGNQNSSDVSAAPVVRQEEKGPAVSSSESSSAVETISVGDLTVSQPDFFSILDRSTGKVQKVKVLDYLYGAVAAELPPDFHPEAMKAQTIASHTYALYCHLHPAPELNGADFSADPQKWEGYVTKDQRIERYPELGETYWQKVSSAVDAVANYLLVYEKEPILAAYHAMSAGATEFASNVWNGSVPYLVPVDSIGDTLAEKFEDSVTFSSAQVKEMLAESYPNLKLDGDNRSWFQIVSRSPSGYVLTLQVGNIQISGKDLRTLLGLRSSNFTVTAQMNAFLFTTKGYGHGVGLSQNGADYMARQGSGYQDILLHYYTGAELAQAVNG